MRPTSLDLSYLALSTLTGGRERVHCGAEVLKGAKSGLPISVKCVHQTCTQSLWWMGNECKSCSARP